MRRKATIILAMAALFVAVGACWGQTTVDDPLHGCIIGTNCFDNGTVTPTTTNPLPGFTYTVSPGPNTGDLLVEILVPNTAPNAGSLSFAINGDNSSLKGDWTSGTLQGFLGISGNPSNPLSAWLGYTNGNHCGNAQNQPCNSTATGYDVYQVDLGTQTLEDPGFNGGFPTAPVLSLTGSPLPIASVLAGFLKPASGNYIATAPSGGIFEADAPPAGAPEPSSVLLLGTFVAGALVLKKKLHKEA